MSIFFSSLKKEVTQGPKPLGAQLPYESDPFEPGNLVLRPVPKTGSIYLILGNTSSENTQNNIFFYLMKSIIKILINKFLSFSGAESDTMLAGASCVIGAGAFPGAG